MSDKELEIQELETIKSQLDMMNIKYHHNAKLETLKTLLADNLKEDTTKVNPVTERRSVREEVLRPVLVKVNCLNPHKSSWRGEKIYFGNSVVGRCVDFVPYNTGDEPQPIWLPKMLVDILKERRFLKTSALRRSEVGVDGIGHSTSWYPEFSVEVIKEG